MASRWNHHLLAAALLAVVGSAAGGCNLVLGIHELPDGGSGGAEACKSDLQCDSHSGCATSACKDGVCETTPLPDGKAPQSAQIPFDCKVVTCVAGVVEQQNDDQDIPDDGEQCTVDSCNGGTASHTAKPHTAGCSMGGSNGLCSKGVCEILCASDAVCDDKNPCTTDACDPATSVCTFTPLDGVPVPGMQQNPGDCQTAVCTAGLVTQANDDTDLPKTPTDCDDELCASGVPSNPPLADTVSCGPSKDRICDGAGTCVECNLPAQCPGTDTDCQKVTCAAHVCGLSFTATGTPRAAQFQAPGDCHVVVCDGAGSSSAAIDDTDLPDDGNGCTKDLCTGGVPTHPFDPAGMACGVNGACTAIGQCGCASDAGCLTPNTCGGGAPGTPFVCGCTPKTCAGVGKTCGTMVTDGCFGAQNCNDFTKNGTETDIDCGGNGTCATTCAQGKQCSADTDCGSGHCADGVCCNQACNGTCQACSAAKKGSGADGVCGSIAFGLQDLSATVTCVSPKVCDGANSCKKTDGQSCLANTECVNGSCADGVCCNQTCTGTCQACSVAAKGSGVDGVCGKIALNLPDTSASITCTGASACDGNGLCKKTLGQACAVGSQCLNGLCSDSVCCGVPSCPACQSCALGGGGTCGNLAAGMNDFTSPNTCAGAMICDGVGACKKINGQACGASGECVSGSCLDGVCCGSASCPTCQSCALGGNGTCANIQAGNPDNVPANACPGMVGACDGAGSCKANNGQPCGSGSTCLSGNCADTVCCNTSCDASKTCMTCNGASPGVCSTVTNADDPDSCSAATQTCDSSGSCLLKPGQLCVSGATCASGVCNGATMVCL